jgi:hypothetical protein
MDKADAAIARILQVPTQPQMPQSYCHRNIADRIIRTTDSSLINYSRNNIYIYMSNPLRY